MPITINKSFTFSGHDAPVYALDKFNENSFFSGGGDRLVSCRGADENAAAIAIVNTGSTIYSLLYLKDKNILLAGVMGGGIHVIDLILKKEIHFLLNHHAGVFDIKYSAKHEIIISAGGDGKISFWSSIDFSFIKELQLCKEKIRTIAINNDENIAAIGCGDGTIRLINLDNLEEILRFDAHMQSVNTLVFHPGKKILISGGKDAHLNLWAIDNYQLIKSIPAHNYAIYSIAFNTDESLFATASRDKTVKIWDAESFEIIYRIDHLKSEGHAYSVNKLLWMKGLLITASDDRKIMGWEIL